jgi:ketosteroid isomerase-like protein
MTTSIPANPAARSNPAEQPEQSPLNQIRALVEELEIIANTHDTDRFMKFFARDPSLVFCFDGQVIHGFDALRVEQLKWWNNGDSDVVYTRGAEPEFIQAAPDLVLVTMVAISSRTISDGTKRSATAAISLVWKKLPEGWRVIYGHESLFH